MVDFVRRAQKAEIVTTAVLFNNAPRSLGIAQLATISRGDPDVKKADLEVARTGNGNIAPASYDLPSEADSVKAQAKLIDAPALNREPGKLFGPRRVAPLPEPLGDK